MNDRENYLINLFITFLFSYFNINKFLRTILKFTRFKAIQKYINTNIIIAVIIRLFSFYLFDFVQLFNF